MVHPVLPVEAKIAFGKVNGTFVSGLLHKREGGKLLASVPEAGQRPRDRALALTRSPPGFSFFLFFLAVTPS